MKTIHSMLAIKRRVLISTLMSALFVLLAASQTPTARAATTWTVTKTADTDVACLPGDCSLREAIAAANAAGGDTINFSLSGCPCTIDLSARLLVDKSLTITGPGESVLVLDSGGLRRVFYINTGTTVNISGLTVQKGSATVRGGGIYMAGGNTSLTHVTLTNNIATSADAAVAGGGVFVLAGSLTMSQVTLSSNHATGTGTGSGSGGGIYVSSGATATISQSTFSGNAALGGSGATVGGGIYNAGSLTLTDVMMSSNAANDWGGGVYNAGPAVLTNVTFTSNQSNHYGGAVTNSSGSQMTLTNATFYDNSAVVSGSVIFNTGGASTTVVNSTIADNASNVAIGGYTPVLLKNTIVANNTGGNCALISGSVTDGGGNLNWLGGTNNCPGTAGNPMLGSLASNGGTVQTRALQTGSAAIDAGNTTTCAGAIGSPTFGAGGTDARGMPRGGGSCDVGAYERGTPSSVAATGGTPQSAVVGSAFATALQATVKDSLNGALDGITVTFAGPGSGAGIVSGGTAITNASGNASVTATANGNAGGPYIVTASASGLTAAEFALTNNPASTTTTVLSSANPSSVGQSITVTAQVVSSAGTPTGTVTFKDGTTTLGTGTLNGSGQAIFSTAALSKGSHSITAKYESDGNYLSSTSTALTQTVNDAKLYLPLTIR